MLYLIETVCNHEYSIIAITSSSSPIKSIVISSYSLSLVGIRINLVFFKCLSALASWEYKHPMIYLATSSIYPFQMKSFEMISCIQYQLQYPTTCESLQ